VTQPEPNVEAQAKWNDGLHFLMQQCADDSKKWFPGSQGLAFMTLAMAGEVGEVANIVKKIERGSYTLDDKLSDTHTVREALAEEVVDVLIYLMNLMGQPEFIDTEWMEVWYRKRKYNQERFSRPVESEDGIITVHFKEVL
jgi:NTP pyrophosphatase (non-canonical NTP hydrolase)